MKNYFIYQYEDNISSSHKIKVTVLFIHQAKIISQNVLAQELSFYFQENSITDKLVVIIPAYLKEESLEYFKSSKNITFARIPGKSANYFDSSLILYQFDQGGNFTLLSGIKPIKEDKFIMHLLRSGATIIFKNNGGLVESTPDHHFVFPSNKHSSKFLRTGNVLINQSEIFFIAVQLLQYIGGRSTIYCDTSSINVLPYAVFELLRRFGQDFDCPIVHSFESYEFFESSTDSFPPESLILISSSTSGNIIDRILKEKRADKEQIQIIYFLGSEERYATHSSSILCNLTKSDLFEIGEDEFATYSNPDSCKLCKNHSRPVDIRGDVFLTVQPKIEYHLLTIKPTYYPQSIGSFVKNYSSRSATQGVIKAYYKDNAPDANYEIYFDVVYLLQNLAKFNKFNTSLTRYIDKYIPANTKYILYLPDIGSKQLAEHIVTKIPPSLSPKLIKLDNNFTDTIKGDNGTVVVVASCITTGKKLLQISRLMRNRENLNIIYFVGIYRPISIAFSNDLISDLSKGKDKSDEKLFIPVETINCSIQQTETSWELEKQFLEDSVGKLDENLDQELYTYLDDRINILRNNKQSLGFSNNVFLQTPTGTNLALRKNFAFWNFVYDESEVAQSEVYFTISAIISNLENRPINSHPSLKQTNYVRNMLSPRNFHRFNDGIIQASLLRSGKTEHFAYDLDTESSLQMKEFLLSIIEKYDSEDGEALVEFILAIGIKRLKLKKKDLREVLSKAMACDNKIIAGLANFVSTQTT